MNELNVNEKKLTSPSNIAEGFNGFFSNIGPNLAEEIGRTDCNFRQYIKKTESEFAAFKAVAVHNVCHLLCQLSGSKATGVDNISSRIIKITATIITARMRSRYKNGSQNILNITIDQFLLF